MKRTNSTIAIFAGLLMAVIGAAAYAASTTSAAPCSPAPGYTDSNMMNNMPTTADHSSWYDELAN